MTQTQLPELANHPQIDEFQGHEHIRANLTVEYILRHFPKKRDILDLGTGRGVFIEYAVGHGLNAHGIDLRDWRYEGDRLRFTQADARDLPFSNCSFDIVTAHHLFDYMDELEKLPPEEIGKVYGEIHRVLRRGGIFIRVPQGNYNDPAEHGFLYKVSEGNRAVFKRIPKFFSFFIPQDYFN